MSGRWAAAAGGPARLARLAAVAIIALAWAWAAHALWRSTVPMSLKAPRIDPSSLFSAHYLHSSASYEEFLNIDQLLGQLTLLAVLAVYAWRGQRLMRESAAGRIGTGMLLGMLGFAIVWLAQLPFELAAVWWERRHGVSHQGYLSSVVEGFLGLGGRFVFICFALLVAMSLAGIARRWWWVFAAPLFAGLALLFTYLSIYLVPNTHPLRDRRTIADLRMLERREGLHDIHAVVQNVSRFTTAPNAESVGFGATRRLILWNTLLDGRFDRREVNVVIGHELGHLAHDHPLERVGWLLLFLMPAAGIVALFTRRRGGLGRPDAVPIALLVFALLQFLASPLMNEAYRRQEAEADWSALRATRDPQAARSLFVRLAKTSLADPDPPTWSFLLYADHPAIVQRIAMVDAWQQRVAHP